MTTFLSIIVFLFGLAWGSFLNCLIYRLALPNFSFKNLGGLKGRSFCPKCRHTLSSLDLVPVLSFVFLRGKCRYCQKKISWQYPLVEISTALIFLLIFNYQLPVFNYLIALFLIFIFVYDLKHYLILDKIIYPAIVIATVFNFSNWLPAFLTAGFFLTIVLVSRGKWMGVGDIKLGFLMGMLLGWPDVYLALFLAFMIGAVVGLALIFLGRKGLKSEVPFGRFLVGGTFAAMFWSEQIINWYLNYV